MGQEVVAVSVVMDQGAEGLREREELERAWAQWNPGPQLRILHTDFTSVVQPIVAFIDEVQEQSDQQIVVLIPVIIPGRLRYRLLHNQIDLVLSSALRSRPDVVVARVAMPLLVPPSNLAPSADVRRGTGTLEGPDSSGPAPTEEPPPPS
jgi:hypothetical protein